MVLLVLVLFGISRNNLEKDINSEATEFTDDPKLFSIGKVRLVQRAVEKVVKPGDC